MFRNRIRIRINLHMTSPNLRNMCLFEHFFKGWILYLEAKICIRIRVKSRIRIRIKVIGIRNTILLVVQVTCSLGYAQYLPRVTRCCRVEDDFLPNLCSPVVQVTCSLGYAQYLPRVKR
jgi:hypothetical protein